MNTSPALTLDELPSFSSFNLPHALTQALTELGFTQPTPIQAQSLHYTLHGVDLIGKAQTGTGKTAAFLLAILTYFLEEEAPKHTATGTPRALILAPTRELALQISQDAAKLMRHTQLTQMAVVGGMDYDKQLTQLQRTQLDLLVATPGRLLDFHFKNQINLSQVEILVLDEADRMLDMGFIPDIKRIIRATPRKEERQTLLFSATFNQDILNLAQQWTHQPYTVDIATQFEASENIEQHAFLVADADKIQLTRKIINHWQLSKVIVFVNRRDTGREVFTALQHQELAVGLLSGEIDQRKRLATLEKFKKGQLEVLVATDVAGRGLHINDISHVINYNLPEDPEDYVHRIGRTGRAGAKGTSISFIGEEDAFALPAIEELIKGKLNCVYPPSELSDSAVSGN